MLLVFANNIIAISIVIQKYIIDYLIDKILIIVVVK